jgi:hypothetical protein
VAITSQAALAANLPEDDAAGRPGFEVADAQLDHGVAAVVGVQPDRGADSVGDEGVVAPGGE